MSEVCLLLEGTYPYVAGGVSSWVSQLVNRLKDVTFSIVYIGPHRAAARKMHYEIPDNVVDFREVYLFDYQINRERTRGSKREAFKKVFNFLTHMRSGEPAYFQDLVEAIGDRRSRALDMHDLTHTWGAWELIRDLYAEEAEEISFVDYFWTWRFLFLPFFSLLRMDLPQADVYHAVSTGYAGVLAALAKYYYGRPLVLTEHGIYTRERKIEIAKASWIYSKTADDIKVVAGREFFREWWISLFSLMSRLTYDRADKIITLFEGNKRIQIEEGAPPKKIDIIPNGVELIPEPDSHSLPHRRLGIGFVGRVVPIKDVKTFIKACRKIWTEVKDIEIYIIGPTDEDEEYYRECLFLTEMTSLQSVIHYTGKVAMQDYYPKLDVVVLTSISEAQPIVILEAMARGIPCVATDVGACRELLCGNTTDDQLLGAGGEITPLCDPEATARAVIRILKDAKLRERMGRAGRSRIKNFYQIDQWVAYYRALYAHFMDQVSWEEETAEVRR